MTLTEIVADIAIPAEGAETLRTLEALTEQDVVIVSVERTNEGLNARLSFPTHESVRATYDGCTERGCTILVRRLTHVADEGVMR